MNELTNGDQIAVWLRSIKKTQLWLSKQMRVHRMAVNYWVNDVVKPNEDHQKALAKLSKNDLPTSMWLDDDAKAAIDRLRKKAKR
jgi:hypothetical protein